MPEKDKTINRCTSWFIPWAAGFLFTLGYAGFDPMLATYPFWKQAAIWICSWLLWPFVLGLHLAGG